MCGCSISRHQLRFDLEPTHVLGRVGELGSDDLDRDVPFSARLPGCIHSPVATAADHLMQDVSAQRSTFQGDWTTLVAGDGPLQLDQTLRRAESRVLDQLLTKVVKHPQRLRLATHRVKRLHQQLSNSLAQWKLDPK